MMKAIIGLGIVDAALLAGLLRSSDDGVSNFLILFYPIIIFATLAAWIGRDSFLKTVLLFEASYSAFAAVTIWWNFFGGEHDAGYQLVLLFIPVFGFFAVLFAGVAAFAVKREAASTKPSD